MITDQMKQLVSAYIDGEVTAQERVDVENLLTNNPECRRYHDDLLKMRQLLQGVSDQPLSLDAQLNIEKQMTKEKNMRPSLLQPITAVLATVLVVFISFQIVFTKGMQGRLKATADGLGIQYSPKVVAKSEIAASAAYQPYYQKIAYVVEESDMMDSNMRAKASDIDVMSSKGLSHEGYQDSTYIKEEFNTEEYGLIQESKFLLAKDNPLSTFSIDVDTASYSNMRRYLSANQLPPKDAVRIEEMINYFSYQYPQPSDNKPFSITTDLAICPWDKTHKLLRIGLKGKVPVQSADLPPSNLVFLVDVSGSMNEPSKLPLLQQGLKMMVNHLRDKDQVAIVTYAGSAGTVLEPTRGDQKAIINAAIDQLTSGGSTAGAAGINQAYALAKQHFIKEGNNRVVLATDGDFNVGVSSSSELTRLIEEKRSDNIFLTVLGFGQGNLKDSRMESLADHGNGNYYYIDTINEARKVLVDELGSTIFTIAKDVKIQIEFNPKFVSSYRLVGYENRTLAKEDFNNDAKDAGEIGAGHTVTALYEIAPVSSDDIVASSDPLKYQQVQVVDSHDLMTVKLRYKDPDSNTSQLITQVINSERINNLTEPVGDFAWASAVAEFGMLLRNSEFKKDSSYEHVLNVTRSLLTQDPQGIRQEFIGLVEKAKSIAPVTQTGNMGFKE